MPGQRHNSTQPPLPPSATTTSQHDDDNDYLRSKSQWSFSISRTINKPIDVVVRNLGGLDNFGKLMMVNPVCLEYRELGRDLVWVGDCGLEDARVREMGGVVLGEGVFASEDDEGRRKRCYERIKFEVKDTLTAFCGLLMDVTVQRGTFVWDDEMRVGLWEVRVLNPVGGEDKAAIDSWARKVIKFRGDGDVTKIEEFVEGYSKESMKILEGLTKRFTRNLHKNWMKRYTDVLNG